MAQNTMDKFEIMFENINLWTFIISIYVLFLGKSLPPKPPFTTSSEDINTLAQFAQASYCDKIYDLKEYKCGYNCSGRAMDTILQNATYDPLTTGGVLVSYNQQLNSIFVSFKGTNTWQKAVLDATLWKSSVDWDFASPWNDTTSLPNDMKIHAGFEIIHSRLRFMVLNTTLELAQRMPNYQIIFTGHSLGGALATLAAVDFHDHYGFGDRISLYTFGAPRVGDRKWARFVNSLPFASRIYRIQRKGDPVVQLPPLFTGYEHSLQQYQILDDRSLIKCSNEEGSGEAPSCLDNLFALRVGKHGEYFNSTSPC
jgi:predicted lipase